MIYIKNEGDQFIREILDVFLNMRRTKIEEIIIKEQLKLADPDEDPEQIMTFLDYLNTKKLEIAKELGAVVSR
jgi:hypothetical protein